MPIDNYFFAVLQREISSKDIDVPALEHYIRRKGMPKNVLGSFDQLLGFVMEVHVRAVLEDLAATFPIVPFSEVEDSGRIRYVMERFGNISCYQIRADGAGSNYLEFDAFYTWNSGPKTPFIVEVTRTREKPRKNTEKKVNLAGSLYEEAPYFILFRIARQRFSIEDIVASIKPYSAGEYHYRRLLLPNDGRYDAIALSLRDNPPKIVGLESYSVA